MKAIIKRPIQVFFFLFIFSITGCDQTDKKSDNGNSDNLIVLVKYKSQQDKGTDAVSQLTQLIEKVKQEPHFINIKLHIDPKDNTNILLYEEWGDESYYNTQHMSTVHLQEFIANSRNFLAGPPEISQWRVERNFK